MQLQVTTKLDLLYTVSVLSRFAHNPREQYWNTLKHVLSYIKGTSHYEIIYKEESDLTPVNYVDSSYARCKDTYKSMEGSIFMVTEEPVLYKYKHQATVALSTVEVKYMRFSQVTAQAIWLAKINNYSNLHLC